MKVYLIFCYQIKNQLHRQDFSIPTNITLYLFFCLNDIFSIFVIFFMITESLVPIKVSGFLAKPLVNIRLLKKLNKYNKYLLIKSNKN